MAEGRGEEEIDGIAASAPIDRLDIALIICFLVHKGSGCSSSQALYSVDPPSRQSVEQFREARLVRITDGGFAISLDPFGMLNPQVVVNLLPKLGVGVDLGRHGN
jgi:hypothetical protein